GQSLAFQGQDEPAIPYFQRASAAFRDARLAGNAADSLHLLGDSFAILKRKSEALQAYEAALAELSKDNQHKTHPVLDTLKDISQVLLEQSNYSEASRRLSETLEISQELNGPDSPATASIAWALGGSLQKEGRYEEALTVFELAKKGFRQGGASLDAALTEQAQGACLISLERWKEAQQCYFSATEQIRLHSGEKTALYAEAIGLLGACQYKSQADENALKTLAAALELTREVHGDEDTRTAELACLIGDLQCRLQQFDDALKSLNLSRDAHAAASPKYQVALVDIRRGTVLGKLGRLDEATQVAESALRELQVILGEKHPDVALALLSLSELSLLEDDIERWQRLSDQGFGILEEVLGNTKTYRSALKSMFVFLHEEGFRGRSESFLQRLVECLRSSGLEGTEALALLLTSLSNVCREGGNYAQARWAAEEALQIRQQLHGAESEKCTLVLLALAGLSGDMGDHIGAEQFLAQALQNQEQHPPDSDLTLSVKYVVAESAYLTGDFEKAAQVGTELLEVIRRKAGDAAQSYRNVLFLLSLVSLAAGDLERSEALLLQHEQTFIGRDRSRLNLANSLEHRGHLAAMQGDFSKSREALGQCVQILAETVEEHDVQFLRARHQLAMTCWNLGDVEATANLLVDVVQRKLKLLDTVAASQSERQQFAFTAQSQPVLDHLLQLSLQHPVHTARTVELALQWKGLTTLRQRQMRAIADSPEIRDRFVMLQSISQHIGRLRKG
ncbi:MAG: tetratricopeptide repeat protein, partial [Planctomyces sp.]